jgi:NADH-quinone oxidoreductase subunit G/NADP-reducing hydrogenase subunit HndD
MTVSIEVNHRQLQAEPGETLLTCIRRHGLSVPTLCHIDGLPPSGACRMCVVEVAGTPNLVPSCAFPAAEGMRVLTHSPRVVEARRTIVELLLADHPDDCLFCARQGNCQLQQLARDLGVRRRYRGAHSPRERDLSSPSIARDPAKCILCGKCVRICEEVQRVAAIDFVGRGSQASVGTAFDEGLNVSSCINCGQCVVVCPTGALTEKSYLDQVVEALDDPDRIVVVQHAPSISVSLGEEFGVPAGVDVAGAMTAALRRIGFDRVFDTSFSADLTIMEEASELVHRLQHGGRLPMLTSCSPGWIKYVETFHPDFLENLSTCKSPQQMLGAVIKSYFAQREGIDPASIFSVSIMPCTAKKYEAARPEMAVDGVPDVDAVLTTRELARLIRARGIDLQRLEPDTADTPFGERTTAGKLFGTSGGVMEAAIRTAHWMVTGRELEELTVEAVRGSAGLKQAYLDVNGIRLGVAVVNGVGNVGRLLDEIRAGRDDLHFIEVMTCPGGCVAGGGQPIGAEQSAIRSRMQSLYIIDADEPVRTSHANQAVRRLYDEFLGEPLGSASHALLHTHYQQQEALR